MTKVRKAHAEYSHMEVLSVEHLSLPSMEKKDINHE